MKLFSDFAIIKDTMDKKRLALEIGLGVLVIALGAALVFVMNKKAPAVSQNNGSVPTGEESPTESKTRLPVPAGATVPEVGGGNAGGAATPTVVRPSGPGADSSIREFRINIDKNAFSPDAIALYVGDVAHINFTAVDKPYEIVQPDNGYRLSIPKGGSKLLEGQFNQAGKFILYCSSCGGPEKGPVGYITVVSKK